MRTNIVGVDEVQTITTTTDTVANEVQTVTTTAIDTDEVQTVSLAATIVDEVQVVRTTTADVPEVQRVTARVSRVDEVQAIGFCLTNIDTASTYTAHGDVANLFTTTSDSGASFSSLTYKLRFDFEECGNSEGVNFCQYGVDATAVHPSADAYQSALGTVTCSSANDNCKTADIPIVEGGSATSNKPTGWTLASAQTVEDALNALYTSQGSSYGFMKDIRDVGVTVSANQWMDSSSSGYYCAQYNITFGGGHLRGNVPALEIPTSSLYALNMDSTSSYATFDSDATFDVCDSASTSTCYSFGNLCDQSTTGASYCVGSTGIAGTLAEGNQPDGNFVLEYECEARTEAAVACVAVSGSTHATVHGANVSQGDWIRLDGLYYQASDALEVKGRVDAPYVGMKSFNVTLSEAYANGADGTKFTFDKASCEVGVFYSDPDADNGVSSVCAANRVRPTSSVSVSATEDTLSTRLRAVETVDSLASLLTVKRTDINYTDSDWVGFYWDVTFKGQNGDLKPMKCTTSEDSSADDYFSQSNAAGVVDCNVTTLQDGSLISGGFRLGTTYPHEYVGSPARYNSSVLRWNVEAATLEAALEAELAVNGDQVWGDVTVDHAAYTPTLATRWSGGYYWAVTSRCARRQRAVMAAFARTEGNAATDTTSCAARPPYDDDPSYSYAVDEALSVEVSHARARRAPSSAPTSRRPCAARPAAARRRRGRHRLDELRGADVRRSLLAAGATISFVVTPPRRHRRRAMSDAVSLATAISATLEAAISDGCPRARSRARRATSA